MEIVLTQVGPSIHFFKSDRIKAAADKGCNKACNLHHHSFLFEIEL